MNENKAELGFFVLNGRPFKDIEKDYKNRYSYKAITQAIHDNENIYEIKYIIPPGIVAIDADSKEAADKIDKLLAANGIETYSYMTKKEGNKHYWFSVPEEHQMYIDNFKLNSNSHILALDYDIDTRAYNEQTGSTGAIYLKREGKDYSMRPNAQTLIKNLKDLPPIPLYLIQHKDLGLIPKSGNGWSNAALPMIGKMKFAKYPLKDIKQIFKEAANYNGDNHSDAEIEHKYNEANLVPWNTGAKKSVDVEVHKQFFLDCEIREIDLKTEKMKLSVKEGKVSEIKLEKVIMGLKRLDSIVIDAGKAPDWLSLKLHNTDVRTIFSIGDTTRVEKRIIESNKLSKYDGILMENNVPLGERLEDKVFRQLRKESKGCGYLVDTKVAAEIAKRVASVVEAPYDNKDIITFKNASIDWRETFKSGKVSWLPSRVENHNPVKWDCYPEKYLLNSPKHAAMAEFMDNLFKKMKVNSKLIYKIGAYTMCKRNFADKIFFFEGKGGEGKSEVSLFIRKMFNDYSCKAYDPIHITMGSEMAFVGTQVVYNDDLTMGKINLKHIKPVATGGSIFIRPLFQNGKDHTPYSTMIFNTNYGVDAGSDVASNALGTRVFTVKFDGPDLRGTDEAREYKRIDPSNNKEFMEVFVSRCVKHIPALLKEEFDDEESKQINNSESIYSNNSVKLFVDEFDPNQEFFDYNTRVYCNLPLTDGRFTIITELYNHYKNWSNEGRYQVFNKKEFAIQFEKLTNVKISSLMATTKKGRSGRWIDLSPLLGLEVKNEES